MKSGTKTGLKRICRRAGVTLFAVLLSSAVLYAQIVSYDDVLKAHQRAEEARTKFAVGVAAFSVFAVSWLIGRFALVRRRVKARRFADVHTSPPMTGLARFLKVMAVICCVVALLLFVLHTYACAVSPKSPDPGPTFLLMVGLMWIQSSLLRQSARLKTPLGEELLSRDQRAPVVFLRGFSGEEIRLDRQKASWWSPPDPWMLEDFVLDEFRKIGPTVGLTNPMLHARPSAYSPIDATSSDWRARAEELIGKSSLVVLVVSTSPGVQWEISHLTANGYLPRVIFLFAPLDPEEVLNQCAWLAGELGFAEETEAEVLYPGAEQKGQYGKAAHLRRTPQWRRLSCSGTARCNGGKGQSTIAFW